MRVDFYWYGYRNFPYEKVLAQRELVALLGQDPISAKDGLSVEAQDEWRNHAYRTTYFREAIAADGSRVIPLQALLEALPGNKRNHRQSTRYSAHGIHDYKGKFNPQVVRAVGNLFGLEPGSWILDPFCGSGTTLLEAAHCGWNAIGVDLNPLAVLIAQAKIAAIHLPMAELREQIDTFSERLARRVNSISFDTGFTETQIQDIGGNGWETLLPSNEYLQSWFPESVLVQISVILSEIGKISSLEIQMILRVILSDILRQVSLQDPGDLRIRRRKSTFLNAPVIPLYLHSVRVKIETIVRARHHITDTDTVQDALLWDSRCCASIVTQHIKFKDVKYFDAAITSPPYATALPYIDTQRLSLVLLGLITADKIHSTEKSLIGNREITTKERLNLEEAIETNANRLPTECSELCQKLRSSLDIETDGFRRRNTPALLYKYLSDMKYMFNDVSNLLKSNAPFAVIVGRNSTQLGKQLLVIDTPYLLSLLAKESGFKVQENLELNTYQRYDIHRTHSIRSETLLILRRG